MDCPIVSDFPPNMHERQRNRFVFLPLADWIIKCIVESLADAVRFKGILWFARNTFTHWNEGGKVKTNYRASMRWTPPITCCSGLDSIAITLWRISAIDIWRSRGECIRLTCTFCWTHRTCLLSLLTLSFSFALHNRPALFVTVAGIVAFGNLADEKGIILSDLQTSFIGDKQWAVLVIECGLTAATVCNPYFVAFVSDFIALTILTHRNVEQSITQCVRAHCTITYYQKWLC